MIKKIFENLILDPLNMILGRRIFYKFNLIIIKIFLKFIGYNNYKNLDKTGEKKFLNSIISKEDCCVIDIGANIGSYSRYILDNSKYSVISFEPLRYSFLELKKLKKIYKKKFNCFNLALSDKIGKTKIFYSKKNQHWANLDNEVNKISLLKDNNKKMYCNRNSLDNFYKKNKKLFTKKIKLIKIDVEGHEYEVLKGSKKFIDKFKPEYIQIEYNWHHLIKNVNLYQFSKILSNYEVFKIMPFFNEIYRIDPMKPENNYFNYSNIVFKIKNGRKK
tara:strand:+ start:3382 stop:4206 length:825 start_codon:yes stop_codon:yes gene_type:complete